MGLKISFFKTPQHRVFHYEPRYWDERKERMEERYKEAEREKALKEGRPWKDENYVPGQNIRGKMKELADANKHHAVKPVISRVITAITLVLLFVLLYYVADYFGWFLEILK